MVAASLSRRRGPFLQVSKQNPRALTERPRLPPTSSYTWAIVTAPASGRLSWTQLDRNETTNG